MNFAAGGGARPTPGKMDTNPNETYTITNGSHFKWKPHQVEMSLGPPTTDLSHIFRLAPICGIN